MGLEVWSEDGGSSGAASASLGRLAWKFPQAVQVWEGDQFSIVSSTFGNR